MKINKLSAPTWRWLRMNETVLEQEADLGACRVEVKCPESVRMEQQTGSAGHKAQDFARVDTGMGSDMTKLLESSHGQGLLFVTSEGAREEQPVTISFRYADGDRDGNTILFYLKKDSELTAVMDYGSDAGMGTAAIQTKIVAEENAKLRLIQIERLGAGFDCLNDIGAICGDGAGLELIQLITGGKDVYTGCKAELAGKASDLAASIGYQVSGTHVLDMNYTALHEGKKSTSHIEANGVLRDSARKLFRGTIDFKKGAAGAKGDELEDVLLLDDGVQNQTIPLILCAEEDVEGNHGASIGSMDEEMMFYLESRGISAEAAYELMANARLKAVCRKIPVERLRKELYEMLEGEITEGTAKDSSTDQADAAREGVRHDG